MPAKLNMKVLPVKMPGGTVLYSAYGWIGGLYITGLGVTHSHAIVIALSRVLLDKID